MVDQVIPQIECVASSENYARFEAKPLEPGFGITVGNALRRVLLSSLEGTAVTWVRIDGIQHEFSVISHAKEDVTEFILNIKQLRLRSLSNRPGRLTIQVMGEGEVTAADITLTADFEIVNPELHLVTLDSPEARLSVELNVERGKGYVPAGERDSLPIGVIPVDAIFTPVRRVSYKVEHTRVGQLTNYDRLILEVWTDGTISPAHAVSSSAQILIQELSYFGELEGPAPVKGRSKRSTSLPPERYNMPIEDLGLSARTLNCLRRSNLARVGEVLETSVEDLLAIKNFGQKSLDELQDKLRALGFFPEKPPHNESEETEAEGDLEENETPD
ncbi:MAG: DNA-directed RNA polymerase subunit alpha [Chloroflexi bacterium]|nr:DNA-directed RNA polymerase subunit alpha [Chloroflexota bacterium]